MWKRGGGGAEVGSLAVVGGVVGEDDAEAGDGLAMEMRDLLMTGR